MTLLEEVQRCYDALNQGDPHAFLDLYDPAIELFIPAWVSPDSGVFRGADAVNRWFGNHFAQWSEQHWELIETLENGPSLAFIVNWAARGRRSGVDLTGRLLVVMSFQEERIASIVLMGGFGEVTSA